MKSVISITPKGNATLSPKPKMLGWPYNWSGCYVRNETPIIQHPSASQSLYYTIPSPTYKSYPHKILQNLIKVHKILELKISIFKFINFLK
jgi:hypothetical protein